MTSAFLDTRRLVLRRFRPDDAARVHALDNDPDVMTYINGGIETPRSIVNKEIMPLLLTYDDERPGLGFWALEARATGSFIGWVCLRPTTRERSEASLGFRLHRAAWGQGLAVEASRALLAWAFSELRLARVVATTYEGNAASRRVLSKLGFVITRRFRVNLEEMDSAFVDVSNPFDGDDLEYVLEREEYLNGTGKH